MLKTERFRNREDELLNALSEKRMVRLWKAHVRTSLRGQPISDLHDYYDFHLNLKNRVRSIREAVRTGIFQPERPIRIRSEKGKGMSRHLVFLTPSDALVIEAIADYIFPYINKAQPHDRAYFSRNVSQPKGPIDVDDSFGYPWWVLWPQFQKKILEFARNRTCVVVTDVATYYDTIDFGQLRNFLSSLGQFSEVLLDFLFFLFERFVWRPDYLPFPGRGLPQINLDAPRLVAHAFLFEVDLLLDKYTCGDFVRWLDDIDFGCDSESEAKRILRAVDEILLSRGLHLNSSKTNILTQKQAFEHFQLRDNRYLTILSRRINRRMNDKLPLCNEINMLRNRFYQFQARERVGQWNKVYKRFINMATDCKAEFLVNSCPTILNEEPSLKDSVYRYYAGMDWSRIREDHLVQSIRNAMDDDSFSRAIDVLLEWQKTPTVAFVQRMRSLAFDIVSNESVRFFGALRLLAKFGNAQNLHKLITRNHQVWRANEWLGRQVAAVWPRLSIRSTQQTVANVVNSFGLKDASAVLANFTHLSLDRPSNASKIRSYILAPSKGGVFPLHKVLITLGVLQATSATKKREELRNDLLEVHGDPIYRFYIVRGY